MVIELNARPGASKVPPSMVEAPITFSRPPQAISASSFSTLFCNENSPSPVASGR
jgi:hypothetical protein